MNRCWVWVYQLKNKASIPLVMPLSGHTARTVCSAIPLKTSKVSSGLHIIKVANEQHLCFVIGFQSLSPIIIGYLEEDLIEVSLQKRSSKTGHRNSYEESNIFASLGKVIDYTVIINRNWMLFTTQYKMSMAIIKRKNKLEHSIEQLQDNRKKIP